MSFSVFVGTPGHGQALVDDQAPQLADVRRYGQHLVRRFVSVARAADQPTFRSLLTDHLGPSVHDLPVTLERWPADQVNVQVALDVVLGEHEADARVVGVSGHRHHGPFGIADLLGESNPTSEVPGPETSPGRRCPVAPAVRHASA